MSDNNTRDGNDITEPAPIKTGSSLGAELENAKAKSAPASAETVIVPTRNVISDLDDLGMFLFDAGLYTEWKIMDQDGEASVLSGTRQFNRHILHYCPRCGEKVPWECDGIYGAYFTQQLQRTMSSEGRIAKDEYEKFKKVQQIKGIPAKCRHQNHALTVYVLVRPGSIQKIGQYPSLAEFGFGAFKDLRSELKRHSEQDNDDFGRALGLFAHGVGAGSFVYLRRIFERLVIDRFSELKGDLGWNEKDFQAKGMTERIELLKDHLPQFLVGNKPLYSVLSIGIHELDEDICLAAFPVIRDAISEILREEIRRKEEQSRKKQVSENLNRLNALLKK